MRRIKLIVIILVVLTISVHGAKKPHRYFFQKVQKHQIFRSPFQRQPKVATFADKLFQKENYKGAITEYKRIQFFCKGNYKINYIKFKIGLCYINLGQYNKAIEVFEGLMYRTKSREISYEVGLIAILTYVGQGNLDLAEYKLTDLLQTYNNEKKQVELHYWLGWIYTLQGKWDKSKRQFNKSKSKVTEATYYFQTSYVLKKQMELQPDNLPSRSPEIAKWLSALPGAGQFYTGHWKDGINSLVLNSFLGYFTVSEIIKGNLFQGSVLLYFVWLRYYVGSSIHARQQAIDFNERERYKFIKELIDENLLSEKNTPVKNKNE